MIDGARTAGIPGPRSWSWASSGSGKTTVGTALAGTAGPARSPTPTTSTPPANIAKMSRRPPAGRRRPAPWLDAIGAWLAHARRTAAASSAARRCKRTLPRPAARPRSRRRLRAPGTATREVIAARLASAARATSCRPRCSTPSSPPSSRCSPTRRGLAARPGDPQQIDERALAVLRTRPTAPRTLARTRPWRHPMTTPSLLAADADRRSPPSGTRGWSPPPWSASR